MSNYNPHTANPVETLFGSAASNDLDLFMIIATTKEVSFINYC